MEKIKFIKFSIKNVNPGKIVFAKVTIKILILEKNWINKKFLHDIKLERTNNRNYIILTNNRNKFKNRFNFKTHKYLNLKDL